MHPVIAREHAGPAGLLAALQGACARVGQTVAAYVGDTVLMQAFVSAAANVMVADGAVAGEEFASALAGMRAHPILSKGYDGPMLESELYDAIGRARTRAGRVENLRRLAAVAERPLAQRDDVFLTAADVADFEGISPVEGRALAEIAQALGVEWTDLLGTAPAKAADAGP